MAVDSDAIHVREAQGNLLSLGGVVSGGSVALPPARLLESEKELAAARGLQAAEYLRTGYVSAADVGPDGTLRGIADPWVPFSRHFGAFDSAGAIRATSRIITSDAPWPLPTLQLGTFDTGLRSTLEQLPAGCVNEISALARHPAAGPQFPRAVFRALWLDALDRGVTDWVLCVDTLVLRSLRRMDPDLFRVVGPAAPAPVRPVLPVWVVMREVRPEIFTHGLTADVRDLIVLP